MDLIADALLLAGALTAAIYCWVLSKRVKGLTDLDAGLGSAIASLSSQVNDMQSALKTAQLATGASVSEMEELAERAERAAEHLKLMLATVQEDRKTPRKKTSRIRKFAKPTAVVANPDPEPEPEPEPELDDEELVAAPAPVPEPALKAVSETETPAQKLQSDIVAKITSRDDEGSREELVQALQTILAANK